MMASLPLQIPCPEFAVPGRVDLLKRLAASIGSHNVNSTAWAILWMSDLDMLRKTVYLATTMPDAVMIMMVGLEGGKIIPRCS
jgi:hypothetical protein